MRISYIPGNQQQGTFESMIFQPFPRWMIVIGRVHPCKIHATFTANPQTHWTLHDGAGGFGVTAPRPRRKRCVVGFGVGEICSNSPKTSVFGWVFGGIRIHWFHCKRFLIQMFKFRFFFMIGKKLSQQVHVNMVIWCQRDTAWELTINMTSNLFTKKNTSNWWRFDTERLVVNVSIIFLVLNLACFDLVWWVEMTFQNYTIYVVIYICIFNLFQKALEPILTKQKVCLSRQVLRILSCFS